jgi:hypothetical protein
MAQHLRRYPKWNRPDHPALGVYGFGSAQLQKEADTLSSFALWIVISKIQPAMLVQSVLGAA